MNVLPVEVYGTEVAGILCWAEWTDFTLTFQHNKLHY